MKYKIDSEVIRKDILILNGWAAGDTPEAKINFELTDQDHQPVDFQFTAMRRDDISEQFFGTRCDEKFGFDIRFVFQSEKTYELSLSDGKTVRKYIFSPARIRSEKGHENDLSVKLRKYLNTDRLYDLRDVVKEKGIRGLARAAGEKLWEKGPDYDEWYSRHTPDKSQLQERKKRILSVQQKSGITLPRFWIFPEGKAETGRLKRSLRKQIYPAEGLLADMAAGTDQKRQTAEEGEFIVFTEPDAVLPEDALLCLAEALLFNPRAEVLYGDEDRLDSFRGKKYIPFFKPDYNQELLRTFNYIGTFFAVSGRCLQEVLAGEEGSRFYEILLNRKKRIGEGWTYDLLLHACREPQLVLHIPEILYHGTYHGEKISYLDSMTELQRKACMDILQRFYQEQGIAASVREGLAPGLIRTRYERKGDPLVSILIPTKDHTEDLDLCLTSLMEKSTYRNFEVIVIENNSVEPETFSYYERIQKEYDQIRVIRWEKGFNFAAINNFGAAYAKGEYLLFLNNDVELLTEDLLEEMLSYAMQEDVGLTGVRLLYPDDTIQHCGVTIGMSGLADHGMQGFLGNEPGTFYRPYCTQDLSAVTAACMMMRKSLFEELGGYEEKLAVAFNDVDLCMKVRTAGKRIIYTPYAVLHHYESKSRGTEDTPAKQARLAQEIACFSEKWEQVLLKGDPYYNRNLTLKKQDFSWKE